MDPIVLGDNEEIEIYGDRLTVPEKSRSRILIRNVVKGAPPPPPVEPPPDPDPEPIPDAENRIINGKLMNEQGQGSLEGWLQEEDKVWFNTHTPLFECNKTYLIQGDRDFPPPAGGNVWKGGNPSTATIWTLTRDNLPQHTQVNLSWVCAHHMFTGIAWWDLFGRNSAAEEWTALGTFNIVEGVPLDKTCNQVGPHAIPVPAGGFRQYRLLAEVTLASDRDGVVFGDIRLGLK